MCLFSTWDNENLIWKGARALEGSAHSGKRELYLHNNNNPINWLTASNLHSAPGSLTVILSVRTLCCRHPELPAQRAEQKRGGKNTPKKKETYITWKGKHTVNFHHILMQGFNRHSLFSLHLTSTVHWSFFILRFYAFLSHPLLLPLLHYSLVLRALPEQTICTRNPIANSAFRQHNLRQRRMEKAC